MASTAEMSSARHQVAVGEISRDPYTVDLDLASHPLLLQYLHSERLAILHFSRQLQSRLSRPVEVSEMVDQWESGPCRSWRQSKTRLDCQMQLREIERHKYLVSQRLGYDIGWEVAALDWVERHAASWRLWWESQPESSPPIPAGDRPTSP